jgi:hypothetical protein
MTPAAAKHLSRKRRSTASRFMVLAIALTFAVQSFLTQTHIHGASQHSSLATAAVDVKAVKEGKAPADNSRSECPLCQAIAHSGVFVAPATSLPCLSLLWVMAVATGFSSLAATYAPAHDWQSRAPPLH